MGLGTRSVLLIIGSALVMGAAPDPAPASAPVPAPAAAPCSAPSAEPQTDPAAARKNAETFNSAVSKLPADEAWLDGFLKLAGDDDTVLRLFSKPKLPVLPNTWEKMTTLQRTDWLKENCRAAEPLLLRVRTPQNAMRWVYLYEVKVGGMMLKDTRPDLKGVRIEIGPRPAPNPNEKDKDDKSKSTPKSRTKRPEPVGRWDLFVLAEDSDNPALRRKRDEAMPSQSYFVPIVFSGDGSPSLKPENFRMEFAQHLQELGYNAGQRQIPGLGRWAPGGQMLSAVSSPRALMVSLGHELPAKK
ncbi:MAG: hypothetical protein FJ253_04520 [Phycisphaerae bacterium]|nr:hypothetical protein [Phycisphaerae bacterium]